MPVPSLDLVLAPDDDAAIRAQWDALAAAGLPSQVRHRSTSNAPHLTVVAAPALIDERPAEQAPAEQAPADRAALERTVAALVASLPVRVPLAGLVLLGRGPYALAHLATPADELRRAVHDVRRAVGEREPWLAHLTLARRLPAPQAGDALQALTDAGRVEAVTLAGLRLWDPATRTVRDLT